MERIEKQLFMAEKVLLVPICAPLRPNPMFTT